MHRIYLDHAATTPMRDEVRAAMEPYLADGFGNPNSIHGWGRRAAAALEGARAAVAEALGAHAGEIVFTRGGTESDNLAVLGRVRATRLEGGRPRVILTAVEHRAVLETAGAVEAEGGSAVILPVAAEGGTELAALDEALGERASVVSMMWVNNETGIVLPVAEAARRARARGVPFHTDAVQAVGKVPVDLSDVPVDLLSLAGHKIHGPKGTGALFVRNGVALAPILFGGGQERGLRPGTQDVAGAVGLAEAVRLAVREREETAARVAALRNRLEVLLRERVEGVRVCGAERLRAPHVSNVGIPGADQEGVLIGLDLAGVAVSSGSACQSGGTRASHVLRALYGDEADGWASVRFSLGPSTTEADVEATVDRLVTVLERARPRARA